jgi:hypothetical protein
MRRSRKRKNLRMDSDLTPRIRLLDLSLLDARELERLLPEGSFKIEQDQLPSSHHGDLGITVAIVAVASLPVMRGIAAWLLKKRHRHSVVLTFEKIRPDKTTERRSLEITLSGSESPGANVLQQIVSSMDLDPTIVITGDQHDN